MVHSGGLLNPWAARPAQVQILSPPQLINMFKVCTTLYGKKKLIPEEEIVDRPAVYGVILKKEKILLVNTRSTGKLWFPGGGVDNDPSSEIALVREVYEETGIEVKINELLAEVESYFYSDPDQTAFRQLAKFYLCTPVTDEVTDQNNPDKSDQAFDPRWIEVSNIKSGNFQDFGEEIFNLALKIKKT